jgi:hypothetical protein
MRMIISLVVEIDENDWPKSEDLPNYVALRIADVIDEANPSLIKALIEIQTASLHVTRCSSCGRENYGLQVAIGSCAWCGFEP